MKFKQILPVVTPIALGCGLTLLGLEILFQFLPVANDISFHNNNIQTPVLTTKGQTITHSLGWRMEQAQTRKVNNYGFIDDRDYQPNVAPVAVIGDSYIKSAMLPYQSTLQNHLALKLKGQTNVYSYGVPGYAFSGYIGTAEYVTKVFKPQAFVFLLSDADIEDSIKAVKGSYYLDRSTQELEFVDSKNSKIGQVMKRSALFRYVTNHLKVQPQELLNFNPKPAPKTQLSALEIGNLSEKLLSLLTHKSTVNPQNTIFVLDSDREVIYGQKSTGKYRDLAIFKRVATARGFQVIDTYNTFDRYYHTTRQKLDFSPIDRHWTGKTHALVADAVAPHLSTILTKQQPQQPISLMSRANNGKLNRKTQ
jgi:hypothetical protein